MARILILIFEKMFAFIAFSVVITMDLSTASYRDIRLSGDNSPNTGTLNILKDGSWGTVCGDSWNKINSDVACRHLGFSNASLLTVGGSMSGASDGEILIGDVICDGTCSQSMDKHCFPDFRRDFIGERHIWDCPHEERPQNCNHGKDVGLTCHIPGYLGCYGNNASDWVLNAGHFRSTVMTIQTCLEFCKQEGFPLAGLQNGADCYCGDKPDVYDRLGQFEDGVCGIRCTGGQKEACGGLDKISVYNVSQSFCDDVDAPPGGWFQGGSMFFGQTLAFGCNNGVELIGNDVIQCVLGNQPHIVRWSAPAPYCFGVTASPLTPKAAKNNPTSGDSLLKENAVIIWSIAGVAGVLLVATIITVAVSIRSMNRTTPDPDANSIDFDLEPAGAAGTYRHSIHSLHLLGHIQENMDNYEQEKEAKSAIYLKEEVQGCVGMQTNALAMVPNKSLEDLEWDEELDSSLEIDRRTSTVEYVSRTAL